jgi:3-deoxy-D-manno-octulosonate 8-phosphate phosphatase (KDO 8-P phosphatase)
MTQTAIRLVVFDVDGVLTDGRLYLQDDGQESKAFHTRDGLGLKALMSFGIAVAVITARQAPLVDRRMQELGIEHYRSGCEDKATALSDIMSSLRLSGEQVAYVGDDLVDWPAMKLCGFKCVPSDGDAWLKTKADYVTQAAGGFGAAREVAEKILSDQNLLDTWRDGFQ